MSDVSIPAMKVLPPRGDADETTNSYGLETWDVFVWTEHPSWGVSFCVGSDRRTGIPLVVGMDVKDHADYCSEGPVRVIGRIGFQEPKK